MSRGFLWIAQNNSTTDYVECSIHLCRSIKQHCRDNQVAVIVDQKTIVPAGIFDHVIVLEKDFSESIEWKMNNEFLVFNLSPFIHTIKLEADMLWTSNTDWWWNYLCQHDLVFSEHCRDYQDHVIEYGPYRKLFVKNNLKDIYNGLHYFRRSQWAVQFYRLCEIIIKNWNMVKDDMLIDCHDETPTTDVVYALANKIQDPLNYRFISYPWFNFIHGKDRIHLNVQHSNNLYNYLHPVIQKDRVYLGGYWLKQPLHYYEKDFTKEEHGRTF